RWQVQLPVAQLRLERNICLGHQESVAYIEETVSNERDTDYQCDWVQHAIFGPPFLKADESTLVTSAQRGITSPLEYEGYSLLASDREFAWPYAPSAKASEPDIDLRKPFSSRAHGFLAAMQMDARRSVQFMLAVNWKLCLGMGYCFRQQDFPWMTLWEENKVRRDLPWNGNTQARGMEFGTTPFPLGREETHPRENVLDTPSGCILPAHGTRTVRYVTFLFEVAAGMHAVETAEAAGDALLLTDRQGNPVLSIPARGCAGFLSARGSDFRRHAQVKGPA
ncbi:MAG: hypothetical protein ACYDCF_08515, partial [Burkholderiales bacterium]